MFFPYLYFRMQINFVVRIALTFCLRQYFGSGSLNLDPDTGCLLIRIQSGYRLFINPDPDQAFMRNYKKINHFKITLIKNRHKCLLKPQQITFRLFKREVYTFFFLFWNTFFGCLDPDPASRYRSGEPIESGSNPDPKHWFTIPHRISHKG
jgi:hypothetical protein